MRKPDHGFIFSYDTVSRLSSKSPWKREWDLGEVIDNVRSSDGIYRARVKYDDHIANQEMADSGRKLQSDVGLLTSSQFYIVKRNTDITLYSDLEGALKAVRIKQ